MILLNGKIIPLGILRTRVAKFRGQGKRIVWTNGCFDLLHAGHIVHLNKARRLGDVLIVGINRAVSIEKLGKGGRPIIPDYQRFISLAGLESVTYVVPFEGLRPYEELEVVKPDIFVKGPDYSYSTIDKGEREIVEKYGGKIIIVEGLLDVSTTKIIKLVKEAT